MNVQDPIKDLGLYNKANWNIVRIIAWELAQCICGSRPPPPPLVFLGVYGGDPGVVVAESHAMWLCD